MATNTSRSCERGRTHRVYATRHAQFANRASFRLFTFWPIRFHAAPSFSSRLPFSFSCLSHALFGARMRALLDRKFVRFSFVWSQWTCARFVISSLSHAPCFIALPVYLIPRVRATVRKLPIFRISRISHILATHFLPSARRLWLFCGVRWTLQGDFIGRTICGCSLECMFQEY